jgi:predicted dehydrogenase
MGQPTVAVVGTGFIGQVHVEALRRLGVHVKGILGSNTEKSLSAAKNLGLEVGYSSFTEETP